MCGGVFDCICMGFCTFMYVRCVCVRVFVVVLYTVCMYVVDVCVVLNSLYVCVSFCFFKNLVGVSAQKGACHAQIKTTYRGMNYWTLCICVYVGDFVSSLVGKTK